MDFETSSPLKSIPNESFHIRKGHCNKVLLIGHSGSGKSYFLQELISNYREVISPPLTETDPPLVYLYSYQSRKPKIRVHPDDVLFFMAGLPTVPMIRELYDKYKGRTSGLIIVLDDALAELEALSVKETIAYTRLIVQNCRHENISLYISIQSPFTKSNVIKILKKNLDQLLLFSVTSNVSSIYLLLTKLLTLENKTICREAYNKLIKLSNGLHHGYLLLDFRLNNPPIPTYRLRNFFISPTQKDKKFKAISRPDMWLYQIKN